MYLYKSCRASEKISALAKKRPVICYKNKKTNKLGVYYGIFFGLHLKHSPGAA